MTTVSTLCATSTVGAAAVGYAFGHQANRPSSLTTPPSNHFHNDTGLPPKHSRRSSLLISSSRTHLRTSTPRSSGFDTSHSHFTTYSTPGTPDTVERPLFRSTRRTSKINSSPVTKSSPGHSPNRAKPFQPSQPARLRRLSSVRLSSLSRPSTSGSRRSRTSSAALTLGSPFGSISDQENAPERNKLVKRSFSVQLFASLSPQGAGADLNATLARPATRHKRTQLLRDSSLPPFEDHPPNKEETYHSKLLHGGTTAEDYSAYHIGEGEEAMPLKNYSAQSLDFSSIINQIAPTSKGPPTLVVVKAVKPTSKALIHSVDEQFYTPLFVKASPHPQHSARNPAWSAEKQLQHLQGGNNSRRSFSIGDLLSNESNQTKGETRKRRRGLSHTFLSRSSSKRGDSAAVSNMRDHESELTTNLRLLPSMNHTTPSSDGPLNDNTDLPKNSESPFPLTSPTQPSRALPTQSSTLHLATPAPSDASVSSVKLKRNVRPSQASVTPSERTSDSGTRVFDDDGELRSDTHFDSIRTALTSSSTGRQGVRLETLFDKQNDVQPSEGHKYLPSTPSGKRPSNISEEGESVVTAVRTDRANGHGSPIPNKRLYSPSLDGTSDGGFSPKPLSLGRLAWDIDGDEDPEAWSADDQKILDTPRPFRTVKQSSVTSPKLSVHKPKLLSPDMSPALGPEQDKKGNLFDWAEQLAPDRNAAHNTPPRPKTVHGKKDTENRGPRGTGRRAQAGLHVRSQSVPALQDMTASRPNIMNKFGTWGIGSKGVTEDWDDDFEFDDALDQGVSAPSNDEPVIEELETSSVFVPKIIQAQQRNVLANISLLREWGLLIEELKELRIKVVSRGIIGDHVIELFDEIDAMVELADQEAEDEVLPSQSSRASTPAMDRRMRNLSLATDTESAQADSLAWDEDVADEDIESRATMTRSSVSPSSKGSPFAGNRPRKDSEAVAKSVIQAIQKKRAPPESLLDVRQHSTPVKKVPFDTATLKHIVPYVNGLVRGAKQVLRDADGLSSAPTTPEQNKEPALAQAFLTPGDSPTTRSEQRLKRSFGYSNYESHANDEH